MYVFKPTMHCLGELIGEEVRAGDLAVKQTGKKKIETHEDLNF